MAVTFAASMVCLQGLRGMTILFDNLLLCGHGKFGIIQPKHGPTSAQQQRHRRNFASVVIWQGPSR